MKTAAFGEYRIKARSDLNPNGGWEPDAVVIGWSTPTADYERELLPPLPTSVLPSEDESDTYAIQFTAWWLSEHPGAAEAP